MVSQMAATLGASDEEFYRVVGESTHGSMTGRYRPMTLQVAHHCQVLRIKPPDEHIELAARLWADYTLQCHRQPFPSSLPTLRAIRERGLKTGLISDCSSEVPEIWPEGELADLIDVAVFSCVAGVRKPDPRIYALACEQLGVAPGRCLYVDDSRAAAVGAQEAGMHPVLMRGSDDRVDEWTGSCISDLREVLVMLG